MEFVRAKSGMEDEFTWKGKPVDKELFISLYVNIMALASAGLDLSAYKETKEFIIIIVKKDGQGTRVVEFSKRDAGSYFMRVDSVSLPFYLQANKIETVRVWLSRIIGRMTY